MRLNRITSGLILLCATSIGCGGSYAGESYAKSSYRSGPTTASMAPESGGDYEDAPMEAMDSGGSYSPDVATLEMKQAPAQYPQPAPPPVPVGAKLSPQGGGGQNTTPAPVAGDGQRAPILIYTADFTMSVFEVEKSLEAVNGLAKGVGGFLARREDRSITIRVPAEKFNEVVTAIEKIGDVLNRNVVSEDVTAEYRDLEVQLANLLALRLRFEKLLEKAQKVEEALQIERELGRVTGEIERIKGRLKLLGDLARYSTITVSFQPRQSQKLQDGPFVLPLPWLGNLGLPHLMNLR